MLFTKPTIKKGTIGCKEVTTELFLPRFKHQRFFEPGKSRTDVSREESLGIQKLSRSAFTCGSERLAESVLATAGMRKRREIDIEKRLAENTAWMNDSPYALWDLHHKAPLPLL